MTGIQISHKGELLVGEQDGMIKTFASSQPLGGNRLNDWYPDQPQGGATGGRAGRDDQDVCLSPVSHWEGID